MTTRQSTILAAVIGAAGVVTGAIAPPIIQIMAGSHIVIQGAIMRSDSDPQKRFPLQKVEVHYEEAGVDRLRKTEQNGGFILPLESKFKAGDPLTLRFHKPCYQDFNETVAVGSVLYTRYLWPDSDPHCNDPTIVSLSLTLQPPPVLLQVVNKGTSRCKGRLPCSPDGKWKAIDASASLDAGDGNTFARGTATCVAGPCPFTQIIEDNFSKGGRTISVTVRNWSDTATYRLSGELAGGSLRARVEGRSFDFAVGLSQEKYLMIDAKTSDGQSLHRYVKDRMPPAIADCQASAQAPTIEYHCTLLPDFQFSPQLQQTPVRIRVPEKTQQAKLLVHPKPIYPNLAKQARIQGTVVLKVIVGYDGTIKTTDLVSGHPILVPAAMEAVKQWVYQPTIMNGQPLEVETQVTLTFTLSY